MGRRARRAFAGALGLLAACSTEAPPPEVESSPRAALSPAADVYAVALALALPLDLPLADRAARVREAQDDLLNRIGPDRLEVVRRFSLVPGLAVRAPAPEVLEALAEDPGVRGVGPDVGGVAHLDDSGPFVGAPALHAAGRRGAGRVVAIVDSGVEATHPDLAGDLVAGACFCTASPTCCGASGITGLGLIAASDETGHGTHVSGIVSSAGQVAPPGIAPDAGLVVVRVMHNGSLGSTSDLVAALEWIRREHPNVDAVNLSLGTTTRYPPRCEQPGPGYTPPTFMLNLIVAFDLLRAAGIVPIASAGNEGDRARSGAPGCLSNVFTVGAIDNAADTVTGFTNSTAAVDVWAPGAGIRSTFLTGAAASLSGTSMSAPHVTAAVALLKQGNAFHPVPTLEACLRTSSSSVTDPQNGLTRPRLDLPSAAAACGDFALGAPCAVGGQCASGFCVDGVCCNQACGGVGVDCLACSVAAGAAVDGLCAVASAGATCRPAAEACDVEERCDGESAVCPADAFVAAGASCRVSAGACDLEERCSGLGPACPPDAKFGGVCRAAAGPCDRPERCDGVRDDCPADALWGASIECRPARGACDVAETCTGVDVGCPADARRVDECRPSAGPCDVAERCDGVALDCGPDVVASSTVSCRPAAGACDVAERCDGATVACPEDRFAWDGAGCPDGVACNGHEICRGGVCTPGAPLTCDDGDPCTAGRCVEPEGCVQERLPNCCATDAACDDGDPCTEDTCSGPGGTCGHVARANCCRGDEACDDGDACTEDRCVAGVCSSEGIMGCCVTDADCARPAAVCEVSTCVAGRCEGRADPDCAAPSGCAATRAPGGGAALSLAAVLLGRRRRRR